ncbi:MAG TPA: hypothetical protein VD994_14075 [Prosthecobacter sp.]|nr:hypothetical protein [Prosthecobacter sp.]
MKAAATFVCLFLAAAVCHGGEVKKFTVNADDMAEGEPPKEVFVVDGTIKIAAKDGNKAIMVDPNPITDASAQLAVSAAGDSTIQAKIFASRRARSLPKFGLSVHGMSGYRLMVNAPKKQLELVKGEQVLQSVPFTWTPDTWVLAKLEVKKSGGEDWTITGKVWPADAAEPAEALVKHSDKGLKGQGKVGLWGVPYSEMPIYFDDIEIAIEVAAAAP